MRKAFALLVAAMLALAVAPAATAHEGHCNDIFMLSGVDAGDSSARQGTNPGAVSCTADDPEIHPDTNFTVPGATHVWVALFDDFAAPRAATIQIGDAAPVTLTFTLNELRGRWESQSIDLIGVAPSTPMTARVDVLPSGYDGDIPEEAFVTNTYIRI